MGDVGIGDPSTTASISNAGFFEWYAVDDRVRGCPTTARLFGLPAWDLWKGLPTQRLLDVVHPSDLPRLVEATQAAMERGGAMDVRYRTLHPNDRVRSVRVRAFCFTDDGAPHCIGSMMAEDEPPSDRRAIEDAFVAHCFEALRLSTALRRPFLTYVLRMALLDSGVDPEASEKAAAAGLLH